MNFMDTQKNGLNKKHFLFKLISILSIALIALIGLFVFFATYSIPKHQLTMMHFENAFSQIKHPEGTKSAQYYTYFGRDPFVSGGDNDECNYYIAETRFASNELNEFKDIEKYYKENVSHLNDAEFSNVKIIILPVSLESVSRIFDFPVYGLIEEYLKSEHKEIPAYVISVIYTDENAIGDFRCWE